MLSLEFTVFTLCTQLITAILIKEKNQKLKVRKQLSN